MNSFDAQSIRSSAKQEGGALNSIFTKNSKMSRGFLSVHALDGLTNYYPSKDPTKIYARPLNYTFYKSKLADEMTGAETAPAGILQTPK